MIKLLSAILALGLAIVFTYFAPNSQSEQIIILVLSAVGTWLGIDWRKQYDEVKNWLKSKTILGALITGISAIILVAVNTSIIGLPEEIVSALNYIVGGGGLLFLVGVYNAIEKKSNR